MLGTVDVEDNTRRDKGNLIWITTLMCFCFKDLVLDSFCNHLRFGFISAPCTGIDGIIGAVFEITFNKWFDWKLLTPPDVYV